MVEDEREGGRLVDDELEVVDDDHEAMSALSARVDDCEIAGGR